MLWISKNPRTNFNTEKEINIKNITEVSNKIMYHINKKSKILCVTDFDVDGLGCAYVFEWFFRKIEYSNYKILIPKREDGYGINKDIIKKHSDYDLIITADNGITKCEEVDYAKLLGLEIIITDHHLPQSNVPKCLILNPKCGSDAFVKELCGTGVVWYLIRNIINNEKLDLDPTTILDMVTISTIADLVELDGANRQIVKFGLNNINSRRFSSFGIEKMFSKFPKEIDSKTIGFGIAPMLNAVGRIDDMNKCFEFITDINLEMYDEIVKINEKRKELQNKYYLLAKDNCDNSKNIIVYENDDIPKGIIGLIASDLSNRFNKPAIVFSKKHGSARSINDINIFDILFNNSNNAITQVGGHEKACGLSISDFDLFKNNIFDICKNKISEQDLESRVYYWKEVCPSKIRDLYFEIKKLEPFGMGNESINIVLKNLEISKTNIVGKNKNVVQIYCNLDNLKMIKFKYEQDEVLKEGVKIDVLGSILENDFNGKLNYQINIIDYKESVI